MKKHILGFVVFSLIVGTAVAVSAMFFGVVNKEQPIKREYVYEVSKRSCWRQVKQESSNIPSKVKIIQAVLNLNTKQLNIDFSTPNQQNVEVNLIYVKKGFLQRAVFNLNPDSENKSTQSMTLSGKWLNDLKSTDNMYVTLKTADNTNGADNNFQSVAVPVLLIPIQ